ncbi:MAG: response regulator [Patescibacteria group bacterium]|nr:response regulator [Patescibacteria group bacterium]
MKILVLDDCWRSMRGLLYQYSPAHYEYEGATTPAEAEKKMQEQKFDVLLLDGHLLNDVTGPITLRRWVAEGRILPPVYMISSDEKMRQDGITAGAAGAINKDKIPDGLKALE